MSRRFHREPNRTLFLPGDWSNDGTIQPEVTLAYGLSGCSGSPLELPEIQEPYFHSQGPGKPEDGHLWFEGPSKVKVIAEAEDKHAAEKEYYRKWRPVDPNRLHPRNYQAGDRWLPWHFKTGEI